MPRLASPYATALQNHARRRPVVDAVVVPLVHARLRLAQIDGGESAHTCIGTFKQPPLAAAGRGGSKPLPRCRTS